MKRQYKTIGVVKIILKYQASTGNTIHSYSTFWNIIYLYIMLCIIHIPVWTYPALLIEHDQQLGK